nr:glycosyltransferase family 2 protein [Bacteroides sp.]
MAQLTLNVAIATLGPDGIRRVAAMTLPEVSGVSYVVSWQTDAPSPVIPSELRRPDVVVLTLPGRGISRNRNNAVTHCRADIILNADDDLHYTTEGLRAVIDAFEANPELDFATFRYSGSNSHKVYPSQSVTLERLPKGFSLGTIELAFRRRVIESGVRFDERFGPGAPLATGEDSLMLLTLRRLGLKGRYFPVTITHHPGVPTGLRPITNPGVARAMGALIGMEYPLTAPLRIPLKAWRMHRSSQMALLPALGALTQGYIRQFTMTRPWNR